MVKMMTVEEIIENEDGSANVIFNMTQEELVQFAQIGLLKILKDSVKDSDKESEQNNI